MFPDIIVDVASATICFLMSCHPVLVGVETPKGEFQLIHYTTTEKVYGGDILVFKETETDLYAIHRVIDVPGQHRLSRIKSPHVSQRSMITAGCVNVEPEVFEELTKCCYASKVIVR